MMYNEESTTASLTLIHADTLDSSNQGSVMGQEDYWDLHGLRRLPANAVGEADKVSVLGWVQMIKKSGGCLGQDIDLACWRSLEMSLVAWMFGCARDG
jgi:hypothetical protein